MREVDVNEIRGGCQIYIYIYIYTYLPTLLYRDLSLAQQGTRGLGTRPQ